MPEDLYRNLPIVGDRAAPLSLSTTITLPQGQSGPGSRPSHNLVKQILAGALESLYMKPRTPLADEPRLPSLGPARQAAAGAPPVVQRHPPGFAVGLYGLPNALFGLDYPLGAEATELMGEITEDVNERLNVGDPTNPIELGARMGGAFAAIPLPVAGTGTSVTAGARGLSKIPGWLRSSPAMAGVQNRIPLTAGQKAKALGKRAGGLALDITTPVLRARSPKHYLGTAAVGTGMGTLAFDSVIEALDGDSNAYTSLWDELKVKDAQGIPLKYFYTAPKSIRRGPKKATPEQWISHLTKDPSVPMGEVDDLIRELGLLETNPEGSHIGTQDTVYGKHFDGTFDKQGRVKTLSNQDMLRLFNRHKHSMEETRLGGFSPADRRRIDHGWDPDESNPQYLRTRAELIDTEIELESAREDSTRAHEIEDLENRREFLEEELRELVPFGSEYHRIEPKFYEPEYETGDYTESGGYDYNEFVIRDPSSEPHNVGSDHFPNIRGGEEQVFHVRLSSFDTPVGKVRFLQESQSDRHQFAQGKVNIFYRNQHSFGKDLPTLPEDMTNYPLIEKARHLFPEEIWRTRKFPLQTKRGYRRREGQSYPTSEAISKVAELNKVIDEAEDVKLKSSNQVINRRAKIVADHPTEVTDPYVLERLVSQDEEYPKLLAKLDKDLRSLKALTSLKDYWLHVSEKERSGGLAAAGDAAFKRDWESLAFKQGVWDAIENDADFFAWTPGWMQADRSQVGEWWGDGIKLEYFHNIGERKPYYNIRSSDELDYPIVNNLTKQQVYGQLGKDVAKPLLQQIEDQYQDRLDEIGEDGSFFGRVERNEATFVGGEGWRRHYDEGHDKEVEKLARYLEMDPRDLRQMVPLRKSVKGYNLDDNALDYLNSPTSDNFDRFINDDLFSRYLETPVGHIAKIDFDAMRRLTQFLWDLGFDREVNDVHKFAHAYNLQMSYIREDVEELEILEKRGAIDTSRLLRNLTKRKEEAAKIRTQFEDSIREAVQKYADQNYDELEKPGDIMVPGIRLTKEIKDKIKREGLPLHSK